MIQKTIGFFCMVPFAAILAIGFLNLIDTVPTDTTAMVVIILLAIFGCWLCNRGGS